MANIKTNNLLPAVYRTDTNKKFLNATLDQLVSKPDLKKINGYIGRVFAPTNKSTDTYINEDTLIRQHYQLEPSVVVTNKSNEIEFFGNYIDLLQQIEYLGGNIDNHDRLFANTSYSYDGLFDFDKFVNFIQYYWLPDGPTAVDVRASGIPITETYTVTRNVELNCYNFSTYGTAPNPNIRLAHGGVYQFVVNQPGVPFWIQSDPGTSGTKRNQPNTSSRDVLGVFNNGIDVGTITFRVPIPTAQDNFNLLNLVDYVDFAIDYAYSDIANHMVSDIIAKHGGLDGITSNLNNKKVIFTSQSYEETFWTSNGIFDFEALDTVDFDNSQYIVSNLRTCIWTIAILTDTNGNEIVRLINPTPINPEIDKVLIKSGATQANAEYYIDRTGYWSLVPNLTAAAPVLYYQDSLVSKLAGQIKLVDPEAGTIDVINEILGKVNYKSPNGVTFTNGLKVSFDLNVIPASYGDKTYYVEGVGKSIRLVPTEQLLALEEHRTTESTPDYVTVNRSSLDRNAWSRHNRWFHIDVINLSAEYNNAVPLVNQDTRAQRPIIEFDADIQLFNYGSIGKDYIDAIVLDTVTDAFTQVEGQLAESSTSATILIGNLELVFNDGDRVAFAVDTDPLTRNKIYRANIVDINSDPLLPDYRVHLTIEADSDILPGNTVFVKRLYSISGNKTYAQYWFDGNDWIYSQQKVTYNQAPLYDVVNVNHVSLSDADAYINTTFKGTKIFSYKVGTGINDAVLGFPLSYRNFNNVGDIEFENNFDNDTFLYSTLTDQKINYYFLEQNLTIDTTAFRNVWTKNTEQTKQYQLFNYIYNGSTNYFEIDALPEVSTGVPTVIVYLNNETLDKSLYTIATVGPRAAVRISIGQLTVGDVINIKVYSNTVSGFAYYEVPQNLDLNSINSSFDSLTLGQLRNHLITTSHNSTAVTGIVPGPSNIRDLPIKQQGGSILQHGSPVIYSNLFLLDKTLNFVKSISLAQKEYSRFKNKFFELAVTEDLIDLNNIPGSVDALLARINRVKNSKFPWYYSDMVPYGDTKQTLNYTVLNPQLKRYELATIFNDTELSNRAVLVYYWTTKKNQYGQIIKLPNGQPVITGRHQLVKGKDFVFEQDRPAIRLLDTTTQLYNDIIVIYDYSDTDGNYIPETPSKLGLYPTFTPSTYIDNTYLTPTKVIQGHDGSITPTFGDYRDDLLLELEQRIYNNIKIDYRKTLIDVYDLIPGKFRKNEYSLVEFNTILTQNFLKWVGNNRVDYSTNSTFDANNPFSWNYKEFFDTVDGAYLPGTWRACYKYFYDTDRPHTHPWEMLGFSEEPSWWESQYGIAPFTGGNLVMWADLEDGYISGEGRFDERFARPGLSKIIPVDDAGNLRSPEKFLVKNFNSSDANTSFAIGDISPTENAWRRSSEFPYALQQVLAVAKPALYFGSARNVARYTINEQLGQHAYTDTLQRITPTNVQVNGYNNAGAIERTAGYINWINDYLTNLGLANSGQKIKDYLGGLSVRLSYKLGGFADKNYIKVLAEQSSPTSTNESVIIPDDNYQIYLNKSTPLRKINYSAVIVQRTQGGWTVSGYDLENPYFLIIPSLSNNNLSTITVGKQSAVIYQDYQNYKVKVPYGFEFTNRQQVVDFLVSYGRYLVGQGMRFEQFNEFLQSQQDWTLSAKEFLTWVQQGWKAGNLLVLSPTINEIHIFTNTGTVDQIENTTNGTKILDQEFNVIKNTQFTVLRDGADFKLTSIEGKTIGFAQLNVVQYEHALIFDNTTLFNDIIYKPELGNRQYRLRLVGSKTGSWNGQLDVPGFIYNNEAVAEWQSGVDYQKGVLITHKNNTYVALQNIIASTDFIAAYWRQIDSRTIKTGLLANFSYNAQLLEDVYDINNQPKNKQINQFSNSLIGFRERNYLTDLGLDVETQSKFYQGFIKEKGTKNAVDALSSVKLNNLGSEITTYEEWGIRVGEYGSIDTNDYVEITLEEAKFSQDPVTFVLLDAEGVAVDQIIGVKPDELYRKPNNYNTHILRNETVPLDKPKPLTAGYVNIDDVNATIYDLTFYNDLGTILAEIGSGYTIWVAKDFTGDWNVFRVTETNNFIVGMEYSFNNLALITTAETHEFVIGDVFAIRNFDSDFDGFYRVFSISNSNQFYVIAQNPDILQTAGQVYSTGLLFKLISVRSNSATAILDVTPPNYWKKGDKVWADNGDGIGNWAVYKKGTPWGVGQAVDLNVGNYTTESQYGASAKLNKNAGILVVGAPNNDSGKGIVRTFIRPGGAKDFVQSTAILSGVPYATQYGAVTDIGSRTVAIAAPSTVDDRGGLVFVYDYTLAGSNLLGVLRNPLTPAASTGDEFGSSISLSKDDRWLYVGAPGNNTVEVYAKDSVPEQTASFTTVSGTYDHVGTNVVVRAVGHSFTAPYGSYVQQGNVVTVIAPDHRLKVGAEFWANITAGITPANAFVVSTVTNANAFSYVTTSSITDDGFLQIQPRVKVLITAGTSANIVANIRGNIDVDNFYYTSNISTTSSGFISIASYTLDFTPTSLETFTVSSQNITYVRDIDYGYSGRRLEFYTAPGIDSITVTEGAYYRHVSTLTPSLGYTGGRFGAAVKTGTEGTQVVIGAPETTVNNITNAGVTFIIDRTAEGFYSTGATNVFTTRVPISSFYAVSVNGVYLTPDEDYTLTQNSVTIKGSLPAGQFIEIETNEFKLINVLGEDEATRSANFGAFVDFCPNNCSIYISAPGYSNDNYFAGRVYRYINQGRLYGSATSKLASPFINALGSYLQSGYIVVVTAPAHGLVVGDTIEITTTSGLTNPGTYKVKSVFNITVNGTYAQSGTTVTVYAPLHGIEAGATVVVAIQNGTALSGTYLVTYATNNTFTYTAATSLTTSGTIQAVTISNSFDYISDVPTDSPGVLRFTTQKLASTITPGHSLKINGIEVVSTSSTVATYADDINLAKIPGVTAETINGQLKINSEVKVAYNVLTILPGTGSIEPGAGTIIQDLGLEIFSLTQRIEHPYPQESEYFGTNIRISDDAETLFVSSKGATGKSFSVIDGSSTTFDQDTTRFADYAIRSGTVYVFDYIQRYDDTISTPGQFAFVQQLYAQNLNGEANFGASIDIGGGYAIIGASSDSRIVTKAGDVYIYSNFSYEKAWQKIRSKGTKVDLTSINRIFAYNKKNQIIQVNFDIYDPAKGKILGIADQELDYVSSFDPARYNQDNPTIDTVVPVTPGVTPNPFTFGTVGITPSWNADQVGHLWWNLDTVRFMEYEQDSLVYRSKNWGRIFPASVIEVCEWVESDFPPSNWPLDGTAKYPDNTHYSLSYYVDKITGAIKAKYYYWVVNRTVVNTLLANKTMSAAAVAQIIENPQAAGVTYAAPIRNDAFNLYNVSKYITGTDIALQVGYNVVANENIIHSEYELIAENGVNTIIPQKIIDKIFDSLTGETIDGNPVPDPGLPYDQRWGIDSRPMQSVFQNRLLALKNFVEFANRVMATVPVVFEFDNKLFYSSDPIPESGTGAWDMQVASYEDVNYINVNLYPVGYKVLVTADSQYDGLWTIWTLDKNKVFELTQIQTYRTDFYIEQIDWYASNFDRTQSITHTVDTYPDIFKLSLAVGDIILVVNDGSGRYAYYRTISDGVTTSVELVGVQNGTVRIKDSLLDPTLEGNSFDSAVFDSTRFDANPVNEIRRIAIAIHESIFIKSLSSEFSKLIFSLINYIFTEQKSVDWIFKSSFITVLHKIRKLSQYPNFVRDNQTYYQEYINEVKPYRTQIREYLLDYEGSDLIQGNVTDFDLPSFYDPLTSSYRGPTLNDTALLQQLPYQYWTNNYKFQVSQVEVVNAGVGYFDPPTVAIVGGGGAGATAVAQLDYAAGSISSILVTNPGSGYTSMPTIIVNGYGSRDTGAVVTPTVVDGVITSVEIINVGSGFTREPIIQVNGSGLNANIQATIDSAGRLDSVTVYNGGTNYFGSNTSITVIEPGTTATAVTRINNIYYKSDPTKSYNTTRSFDEIIKFDRITYTSNIKNWSANTTYYLGDTVSYEGAGWRANTAQAWGNLRYPSTTLISYQGNTYLAANANTTLGGISVTFGNVVYENANVLTYFGNTAYAANSIVLYDGLYYINANANANISGTSYTFSSGVRKNANVEIWSNVKNYTTSNIFSYLGNTYILANTISNASGVSIAFESWANTTPRAARLNANIVVWEPGTLYPDTENIVIDFLGSYVIANTEIIGANLYANSGRFFGNANVVYSTSSNLTFSLGNVIASTAQEATFNLGNVIQGVQRVTFSPGNARVISTPTTITWYNNNASSSDTIIRWNSGTYIAANAQSTVWGNSFAFPKWSNTNPRAGRINANIVTWQANTVYDTTQTYVLNIGGNIAIVDTEIPSANIFATSLATFNYSNVVIATNSNITFNSANLTAVDATIYPSSILALDSNITINKDTYIGILNSSGRATVSANTTQGNIVFVTNTTSVLTGGTGSWLYRANTQSGAFESNLGARVYSVTTVFDTSNYTEINPSAFDNANDRTMACYTPTVGMPGKDLAQLYSGIDYPGVQIQGSTYDANVTVTTNVLQFFAVNSTVQTTNLASFNFLRQTFVPGQKVTISGSAYNNFEWTISVVKDYQMILFGNLNVSVQDEFAGNVIQLKYFNEADPLDVDSQITSYYKDTALGLRPEDIVVDGGKFVDTYSSHAPEELVPGRVFDNLNLQVYTIMRGGTANIGYRVAHNMYADPSSTDSTVWPEYYRINSTNSTTLTEDLQYDDTEIHVANALLMPLPGPTRGVAGVVYINGEKIYYYRNYAKEAVDWIPNSLELANEFSGDAIVRYLGDYYTGVNANVTLTGFEFPFGNARVVDPNVLGQIRRGVDGTGIALTHVTGSPVIDSSIGEKIPGEAHLSTWLNLDLSTPQQIVTAVLEEPLADQTGNILTTTVYLQGAITDGAGLEGSRTVQAQFLKQNY
jgi:hypothetical protein